MDEQQANAIADVLGGTAWNSGGDIWLLRIERADGKLVIISDDAVCEYDNEDAFDKNNPSQSIILT